MQTRSLLMIGLGAIAATALGQAGTAPAEPKSSTNTQTSPGGSTPAPAANTAPRAKPRNAPPPNGTAPIEPKH